MGLDRESIEASEAFHTQWYYLLELAPGLWSPGREQGNIALTRELLRQVDVRGARCLDVGTQEAMVPILLGRRGAGGMVAYDRILRRKQLDLVRDALDADFNYVGDFPLAQLPASTREGGPFDVVVFSGVLYHMFDPLAGLAIVRGLVRNGGILVIETEVIFDDSVAMHFNRRGRFDDYSFWYVSVPCVEYLLGLVRLQPLEMIHFAPREMRPGDPPRTRMAVACRAIAEHADATDPLVQTMHEGPDFPEFLDWGFVSSSRPEVGFKQVREGVQREDGSFDLWATAREAEPYRLTPEWMRLPLDADY